MPGESVFGESTPRIVIYGVGRFGQAAARLALDRGWAVVGAYNRSGPKVGRRLAELICDPRAGEVCVQDAETIGARGLAEAADIAVVTVSDRLKVNMPAYRRLLSAGLSIVCLGGEATCPAAVDVAVATEIDHLARSRSVTLTGLSVWDAYRVWPVLGLAGACHEVRSLRHRSLTLVDQFGPAAARAVGVGESPTRYERKLAERDPSLYRVFMHLVVLALGRQVVDVRERAEPIVAEHEMWSGALAHHIPPGTVIGTRISTDVHTADGCFASAEIETRLGRRGEQQYMDWFVDGDPAAQVSVRREDSVVTTAACIANRVPDVIAAPPGLVTVDRLGPMRRAASR